MNNILQLSSTKEVSFEWLHYRISFTIQWKIDK